MSKDQSLSINPIRLSSNILRVIEEGINLGLVNLAGRGIDDALAISISTVINNKLANLSERKIIKINFLDNNITNEGAKVISQWYQLCFDFYKFYEFGVTTSNQVFLGKNKLITEEFKNNYNNPVKKVRINDTFTGENLENSKKLSPNKTKEKSVEKIRDASQYLESDYNQTGFTKKMLPKKFINTEELVFQETGEHNVISISGTILANDETV